MLDKLNFNKIRSFIMLFCSTFLGKFIGILTIGIISRNILVSDKGIYDYYNVIVSYIILFINFGFELYFMELNINKKVPTEYLFSVQVRARGSISLILITLTTISLFISGNLTSKTILLILLMLKLLSYTFDVTWNLRIDEKFNKIAKYEIINSFIKLILVYFIIRGNNIMALVLIDILLDYILKLNIYFNYKYKILKSVTFKDVINIIKKSFIINLSSFMISIYYSVDTLMLGIFRSSTEVAIYTGAYTFLAMAIIPTSILYQIYSPQLIKNKGNKSILHKYIIVTALTGIVVFLGVRLIGAFAIKIILGSQYNDSAELLKVLCIDLVPCYLAGALANPINAWGNYNSYFKVVMIGGLFNIISNFFIIPIYGYYGAVITTILSEVIVFIVALIWWTKKREWMGEMNEDSVNT